MVDFYFLYNSTTVEIWGGGTHCCAHLSQMHCAQEWKNFVFVLFTLTTFNNRQENLEHIIKVKFYEEGGNPNLISYYLIRLETFKFPEVLVNLLNWRFWNFYNSFSSSFFFLPKLKTVKYLRHFWSIHRSFFMNLPTVFIYKFCRRKPI